MKNTLVNQIIQSAVDSKAINPIAYDVKGFVDYTENVILLSGRSDRHTIGIANRIIDDLSKQKIKPKYLEGYDKGHWILIDFFDVVVHVFYEQTREVYNLEALFHKAKMMNLSKILDSAKKEAA